MLLFELTTPDRSYALTTDSLAAAVGGALAKAGALVQPKALRAALDHAEPYLPALAEAAGTGFAGQIAVRAAVELARHALDDFAEDGDVDAARTPDNIVLDTAEGARETTEDPIAS